MSHETREKIGGVLYGALAALILMSPALYWALTA
jgi:hypothetical protein